MPDPDAVRAIRDHLAATAELPVDPGASVYLGEAEAVAQDAVAALEQDADAAVVRKRVEQVCDLLAAVEETGHETADDHVAAARELAADVTCA